VGERKREIEWESLTKKHIQMKRDMEREKQLERERDR
jgi:hypothetical protein